MKEYNKLQNESFDSDVVSEPMTSFSGLSAGISASCDCPMSKEQFLKDCIPVEDARIMLLAKVHQHFAR